MNKNKKWALVFGAIALICLVSLIWTLVSWNSDTRDDPKDYRVEVLGKVNTESAYKVSAKFIIFLKNTENGNTFDLDVSPITWFEAEKGDILIFNLSPWQAGEKQNKDLFTFVMSMFILGCCVPIFIGYSGKCMLEYLNERDE